MANKTCIKLLTEQKKKQKQIKKIRKKIKKLN